MSNLDFPASTLYYEIHGPCPLMVTIPRCSIGTGTDVAMAASDITLIGGDLRTIVTALTLSRKTVGVIKQGLLWVFAYNVMLIPVAMGLLYPFFSLLLNPVLAAAAMAMSIVSVVTNALRLSRFRRPESARAILHPGPRERVGEYGCLVAIELVALAVGALALACSRPDAGSGMNMPMGTPSPASATRVPDRAIAISATDDLRFSPAETNVRVGETIAFDVTNRGALPHEFVIGGAAKQQQHEQAMAGGSMPMETNAVDVPAGKTVRLVYTFDQPGTLEYGCHVSGHYAAGMRGALTVTSS